MLESEQAQAIAEIEKRHRLEDEIILFEPAWVASQEHTDRSTLLEIIHSQSQRIESLETAQEEMHAHTVTTNALYFQAEDELQKRRKLDAVVWRYVYEKGTIKELREAIEEFEGWPSAESMREAVQIAGHMLESEQAQAIAETITHD